MRLDADFAGDRTMGRQLALHFARRFVVEYELDADPYDSLALLRFTSSTRGGTIRLLRGIVEEFHDTRPAVDVAFVDMSTLVDLVIKGIRFDDGLGARRRLTGIDVLVVDDLDPDPDSPVTWDQVQLLLAHLWQTGTRIVSAGSSSLADRWFNVSTGWFHVPVS